MIAETKIEMNTPTDERYTHSFTHSLTDIFSSFHKRDIYLFIYFKLMHSSTRINMQHVKKTAVHTGKRRAKKERKQARNDVKCSLRFTLMCRIFCSCFSSAQFFWIIFYAEVFFHFRSLCVPILVKKNKHSQQINCKQKKFVHIENIWILVEYTSKANFKANILLCA